MSDFYDFGDIISDFNDNFQEVLYRSICYTPQMPLKTSLFKTKILAGEQYRPDKVSYRLFSNPYLSWIIDELNSFYSFKDYTTGKEIYYIPEKSLNIINVNNDYISYDF